MFFNLFGKKTSAAAQPSSEDVLAEIAARTGAMTRARDLPAWALMLRSPYKSYPQATSWLGGVPHVPPAFKWPTGNNGRPLHFIAQIDLAALKPEPSTGARAPGLPTEGALLVFIGDEYAVRVLSPNDMAQAAASTPPSTLMDLSEFGFWGEGSTFFRWPVDPVAYLSHGEERPDFLPDPFATPQQWIINWGLAALEASLTHEALARELRLGREFIEGRRSLAARGGKLPSMPHINLRIAHCALMEDHAPQLLAALKDWQTMAASRPAESPVDASALSAIFAERTRLSRAMESDYGSRNVLEGSARIVWEKVMADLPGRSGSKDFAAVAPAHRPLIDAWVTDWRGHRLLGLEPDFPNNGEDLRHQNPLISIRADPLLGSEAEHHYGFSVWLRDDDIASGRHTGGQLIWHCAV